MNFFTNIIDSVKRKSAELKDRKEFLDMVEEQAKPIRRRSYMQQMLKEVVQEGIDKAKADSALKNQKKKRTQEDFGIGKGLEDPFKYMKGSNLDKRTKSKGSKK